jgi:outer membrane protein assembly factor BamB
MRGLIATAATVGALAAAAPADAQLPLPPLPPIGPPGGTPSPQPPPQSQPPAAQPQGSPPTGSVTVGVNATHTGFVDDQNLVPPLVRRWARSFGGPVGPVRAADGRLYTLASAGGTFALRALSPVTGRDLWVRPIPQSNLLAYDGGRLFAVGGDGVVRAFSASNGAPLWQRRPASGNPPAASPVATGGVVYVTADDYVVALSGATGAQLWKVRGSGTDNVPAVDSQRAYVAYACAQVRAYNRSDGKTAWEHHTDCGGGGGSTPSVFGSALYVPERSLVLDRATGAARGTFFGSVTPVFARGYGLFRQNGTLMAKNMANGKTVWTHPGEGDERVASPIDVGPPTAVYHSVYRLTPGGSLYALSLENGRRIWRTQLPDRQGGYGVETADQVAVAPGLLLIPRGRRLVAFQSYFRPAPDGIAFAPGAFELEYGRRTFADGVIGANLRGPNAQVRIEWDEHPFRGFTRGASGTTAPDGYFDYTLKPDLNVRLRFRSGNAVSAVRTVYVYPRTRFKFKRPSRNSVRALISFRNVGRVNLGGRRASLYIARIKQKRFDRLGSATVRRQGRGRSALTVGFRALRHVGKRDYLAVCVKGQARLGLGRPDRFTRGCGKRRIRF